MGASRQEENSPPPAGGARLDWQELPSRVRVAVEKWLGSPVVSARTEKGGFSPGVAARLLTRNGRRVFLKAAGPLPNPSAPRFHRRELTVARALPARVPAPRLLWWHDEGEGGWVALIFEEIDGRNPEQPWRGDELARVVEAAVRLSQELTPSPVAHETTGRASDHFAGRICGWRLLLEEQPPGLDEWSVRHISELSRLEEHAPDAVDGDTLVHFDIRADNVLLTRESVYFVDWAHTRVGAPWLDLVLFAPSATVQGGPGPEALLRQHPASRTAGEETLTIAIASMAGFFTREALLPSPPGLPTLRAFQAAQGAVARQWVAMRTGWE